MQSTLGLVFFVALLSVISADQIDLIVNGQFNYAGDNGYGWTIKSTSGAPAFSDGYVTIPPQNGNKAYSAVSQMITIPYDATDLILTIFIKGGTTQVAIGTDGTVASLSLSSGQTIANLTKYLDSTTNSQENLGAFPESVLFSLTSTSSNSPAVIQAVSLYYTSVPTAAPTTAAPPTVPATTQPATTSAPTSAPTATAASSKCTRFVGPNNPAGPSGPHNPSGPNNCDENYGPDGFNGVNNDAKPSNPVGPDNASNFAGPSNPTGPTGKTGKTGKTGFTGPSH